jgi:hypothetical protein
VVVTLVWVGLAAAAAGWELFSRRAGSRWTSLGDVVARLGSRRAGRLVLLVLWAFVGWHVFARYTVPG